MDKIDYEKRRSEVKKYMVFIDEFKTKPHLFHDIEIGNQYKMENGLTYVVLDIQKDSYRDIDFAYLKNIDLF